MYIFRYGLGNMGLLILLTLVLQKMLHDMLHIRGIQYSRLDNNAYLSWIILSIGRGVLKFRQCDVYSRVMSEVEYRFQSREDLR